jgi:clan AA aspartic protease
VKGIVDEELRALIDISISAIGGVNKEPLQVWIDTAFNGGLVIPRSVIERLGLKEASSAPAILADGQLVDLTTFTCYLSWFGKEYRTQVVANDGEFPLLGTMLLADHRLLVEYKLKSVSLD